MNLFKLMFVAVAAMAVSVAAVPSAVTEHDTEYIAATAGVESTGVAVLPAEAARPVLGQRVEAPHSVFVLDDKASPFFHAPALPVRLNPG